MSNIHEEFQTATIISLIRYAQKLETLIETNPYIQKELKKISRPIILEENELNREYYVGIKTKK